METVKLEPREPYLMNADGSKVTYSELLMDLLRSQRQQAASRYYVHKFRAHQYAVACLQGVLTLEQAREKYDEAMRNYDQIIEAAETGGHSSIANAEDLARGADAVTQMVEDYRAENGG